MNDPAVRILQVSPSDRMGGAEAIAWALHQRLNRAGDECWLAVGQRTRAEPAERVLHLDNDRSRNPWARFWRTAAGWLDPVDRVRGIKRLQLTLRDWIGQPWRTFRTWRGWEDFDFPATAGLLDLAPVPIDLVHCHNLHSPRGYFDLRQLPELSAHLPVMLTLHDAWPLSGHCAHSFECQRWKTGCGGCPDLSIYPAVARDATAANWRRKREIFARCRLHVSTPSQWLMRKVEQSMLAPAVAGSRVIPNGVDLDVFVPGDQRQARASLGIDPGAAVLLFAAAGIRDNCFKDFRTMRQALGQVAEGLGDRSLLCIALGEEGPDERIGAAVVRFARFESDPRRVARYFQAVDVYVHPARAETFPTTVLEAMACGRAVVASRVGGIPEQVEENATGLLAGVGDAQELAQAILAVLINEPWRQAMGRRAAEVAKSRYGVTRMVEAYRAWYGQILADRNRPT